VEGRAHFLDVRAVTANGLMELITGYAKLLRPIGNVRCNFWVDFLRIVRSLGVFLVNGVRSAGLWCIVMLSHLKVDDWRARCDA
jgi:hypothetical protein